MKTKIICTIGPASQLKETMLKMAEAGMAVARLNFLHGDPNQHQMFINTIREINRRHGFDIKILQDLEGYRIRLGHLKHPVQLIKYQEIYMSQDPSAQIPLDLDIAHIRIKKGIDIFVDDG